MALVLSVSAGYYLGPAVLGLEGAQDGSDDGRDKGVTDPNDPAAPTADVDGTTTLVTSKETSGFWKKELTYDWSIGKYVIGNEEVSVSDAGRLGTALVPEGETVTIDYLLDVKRYLVEEKEYMGVCGYVCVKNAGDRPTEKLAIVDHVQACDEATGSFVDIAVFGVDTSSHPVLQAGEECTYYFEYTFNAVISSEYRNMACVSITNHEGFDGIKHNVPACDGFEMPSQPELIETDETASVVDQVHCPENFECVTSDDGPWVFYDSEMVYFSAEVINFNAGCEQERCLCNKATLTELDTCQVREDCAYVNLVTGPCRCETAITVEKTAELVWERTVEYDWTVEKSFYVQSGVQKVGVLSTPAADLVLGVGETGQVCYVIEASRGEAEMTESIWLVGEITVCNTGNCPTEGLVISDVFVVEYNGVQYAFDFAVSTEDRQVLGPGECFDYEYEVDVTEFLLGILYANDPVVAESSLEMANRASAGITNYEGQEGIYFVDDEVEVELPEPETEYIDETATLTDLETFPKGFDMDLAPGPWHLEGSDTIRFCKNITNVDAECGSTYYFNDTAKLVEDDSGTEHEGDVSVVITTPECECGGCTRTIGYWKNHAGQGPGNQADEITPLIAAAGGTIWLGTPGGAKSIAVTSAAQAASIIDNAGGANKFNQLYAQMLAAKLNALNGACDDAIEETVTAADTFLATHNAGDWDSLSKADQKKVNGWATTFEAYNSGEIGPGHCD